MINLINVIIDLYTNKVILKGIFCALILEFWELPKILFFNPPMF